jgi:CheY-like chemotaxis protein
MSTDDNKARVLLLVEDNPGDAALVSASLEGEGRDAYHIVHVPRLADAVAKLRSTDVDVVVLDLQLPDCAGVEAVMTLRSAVGEVPIVVLTGTADEQLALACLDAGAEDYLAKAEAHAHALRRSIGYAITRKREIQLRELRAALDYYRTLSSTHQGTTVTAALAGSGAVSTRSPQRFEDIVGAYFALFVDYLGKATDRLDAPRVEKERIITLIGDANGGPRDLIDVHMAALDRAAALGDEPRARSLVFEARLLALEMMGLLVDYYRVGHRRRFLERARK